MPTLRMVRLIQSLLSPTCLMLTRYCWPLLSGPELTLATWWYQGVSYCTFILFQSLSFCSRLENPKSIFRTFLEHFIKLSFGVIFWVLTACTVCTQSIGQINLEVIMSPFTWWPPRAQWADRKLPDTWHVRSTWATCQSQRHACNYLIGFFLPIKQKVSCILTDAAWLPSVTDCSGWRTTTLGGQESWEISETETLRE